MTDKQIATYCDDVKQTALKQFYKIQNQRKEISILHKKCVRQQADNERLKKLLEEADVNYNKCAKRFYKEGVKDFAERLKKKKNTVCAGHGITTYAVDEYDIDCILKEMVGDDK
jgi:hypothetical protein